MIGALAAKLDGQRRDLELEVIDQLQADVDVAPPRIGDREAIRQLPAGEAEEIRTGQGCPKVISVAWMRFFSVVRWRTRCSR